MVNTEDRELRRHALRFIAATPDGEENSRIVYHQLVDYGHRVTWAEFDRLIVYLERAGYLVVRWIRPEVDRTRMLRITKAGLDVLEGTIADPAVMPPAQGGR